MALSITLTLVMKYMIIGHHTRSVGLKHGIYEGGRRMPFIIKYAGVTKAGTTSDALVSQIDIMTTIAAALDHPLPEKNSVEDLYDLMPLIRGENLTRA